MSEQPPADRVAVASSRPWWVVAGVGAALVVVSVVGDFSWTGLAGGIGVGPGVEEAQTYRQPVKSLSVTGGAGDVVVRQGAPAGTVEVTRRLGWSPGSSRPSADETWDGDALRIDADCGALLGWCSIDYVVTVPDGTAVTVETGSGDIDVDLAAVSAPVDLRAGSGDVSVTVPRDGAYAVRTGTGSGDEDVEVTSDASASARLDVETGSGDIEISYR